MVLFLMAANMPKFALLWMPYGIFMLKNLYVHNAERGLMHKSGVLSQKFI